MNITIQIKTIPLHEVLFIFKNGRQGFEVFIKCARSLIGFNREFDTDGHIYYELKPPFRRGMFFAIISDFFSKNQFNAHLFSKTLIIETCRRICSVQPARCDRQTVDRPGNTYFKKMQRLNYVE